MLVEVRPDAGQRVPQLLPTGLLSQFAVGLPTGVEQLVLELVEPHEIGVDLHGGGRGQRINVQQHLALLLRTQ